MGAALQFILQRIHVALIIRRRRRENLSDGITPKPKPN